jgi:VWFA-related protein
MRFVLAVLALTMLGAAPASQQPPIEPRPGRLLIDAVVTDAHGMPVLDVRPSELEVWIVGYRIPIETLTIVQPTAGVPSGRSIVLLLDDIHVDNAVIPRARDAARQFVSGMRPDDRLAVATLSGTSMAPTSDRARLLQRIDTYAPHAWAVERPDTMGAHILDTISALSRSLTNPAGERKAIVAIGPSGLLDTPIPPPNAGGDLRREWVDAMRAMAASNVALYVIDPAGVGGSRLTAGDTGFARETGGMAFLNTNGMKEAADRILREAGTYYVIDIADPPMGRQMDLRALDVRVLRHGITVRARRAVPGVR